MYVRKICVFLFVNCVFIYRRANTFVASYAMKYSEISFVTRKFLAYTPPPPPNYACLATALAITCLISMYMTNIYVKFLLNAMVSNTIFATFWAVTITKIIAKIIVGIIVFINCSLKRCKSNIRNLSEVMHVGGGGGVMGRKRAVERGPLKIFLHLLGGHDEIMNESMQNHQPPPPPPLLIKNERSLRKEAQYKDITSTFTDQVYNLVRIDCSTNYKDIHNIICA